MLRVQCENYRKNDVVLVANEEIVAHRQATIINISHMLSALISEPVTMPLAVKRGMKKMKAR